jgi:hypothetical protein
VAFHAGIIEEMFKKIQDWILGKLVDSVDPTLDRSRKVRYEPMPEGQRRHIERSMEQIKLKPRCRCPHCEEVKPHDPGIVKVLGLENDWPEVIDG